MNTAEKQALPLEVPHFGVNVANDIPYLFQDINQRGFDFRGFNSESGMIARDIQRHCPHSMNMYQAKKSIPKNLEQKLKAVSKDPLFIAMSPYEHTLKPSAVMGFNQEIMLPGLWLKSLERLSSPKFSHVFNIEKMSLKKLEVDLSITNIQPLAIYGITKDHTLKLQRILKIAENKPRTLVLLGSHLPGVPKYTSSIVDGHLNDIVGLPLEHYGTRLIQMLYTKGLFPWE